MKNAYEEVQLALYNDKKYLSEETLQLCLEALREHEERKHNGYSNYPTWLLAAAIDNDQTYYKQFYDPSINDISILVHKLENLLETDCTLMKNLNECLLHFIKCKINLIEIARNIKNI